MENRIDNNSSGDRMRPVVNYLRTANHNTCWNTIIRLHRQEEELKMVFQLFRHVRHLLEHLMDFWIENVYPVSFGHLAVHLSEYLADFS